MRTILLHPSSAISDDVPIEQIRLPWNIRRTLSEAGLKTVGDVRKATIETMLEPRYGGLYPCNARLNGKSRPEATRRVVELGLKAKAPK